MPRVKVPGKHAELVIFDGDKSHTYVVEGGEVVAKDGHIAAILASVPGSELAQEAPAKKEK
jgi:hypothetical protein